MTVIENDLSYFHEGAAQLKDYLLGKELLSWQLGQNLPSLTPGNLLLAQARLLARNLDAEQQSTFDKVNVQFQELISQWRSAWEKKSRDEFSARLRQWGFILADLDKDKDVNYFLNMVHVRAMLELFKRDFKVDEAELAELDHLDTHLRAGFESGGFIWETELQPAFPQEQYWFLYAGVG